MSDEYLMTGCFGLDKDAWQTVFYDDDLPTDWRAAFYSTLLRSVYLAPDEWRQAIENNWSDEVDEGFRIVLHAQRMEDIREIAELNQDFADLVAGVVFEVNAGTDESLQKNEIEAVQKLFPVCLDAGPVDYAECGIDKRCDELALSAVWYPAVQKAPLASGDFLVTLISDEALPAQREIVAEIQNWMSGQRRAGLFNTSEKDAPVKAQETRILVELMGV